MRNVVIALGLAAVASAAHAQDPNAAANELKRWAGYWKPQSVVFDGKEQLPTSQVREPLTLVVKDGEYRMYYCSDKAKDVHFRLFTAALAVDPAARTFVLDVKDGQKKNEKRHGIYELSGAQLKICYGPAEQPQPTTFAAPPGSGFFLETWAPEKR